MIIMFTAAV